MGMNFQLSVYKVPYILFAFIGSYYSLMTENHRYFRLRGGTH